MIGEEWKRDGNGKGVRKENILRDKREIEREEFQKDACG